ncbi:ATPase, AAA domain containing protein [Acanthamoeba castellanii str. Neff]|uniref:ATPase, AAA domain containing protein n=1 Tax=Acanthamoeba castellanii (strain ATCC 30010 / Neff) TaxID=1257118 RepID=L8H211_ACACF|nr:ATPase, AAA domain containing protein [Acanthamoeba castellanii str. Neff]ELR19280.1 ATPase, AAA domain containing protein [Acanthamoeba castellanii str. Neff]
MSNRTPTAGAKKRGVTPPVSPYKAPGSSGDASPSRSTAPSKSPLTPSSSLPQRLEPYTEREAKIERERRRGLVFVHLRTLQRLGVVIGDPVALHVARPDASGQAGVVVGQAWVGSNVGEDEVHVDPLMADNCGAKFGQLALLQPLDPHGAPDGNAAERPTVRVAVVGASEVAVMPLSPPPPQALSAPSEGGATASTGSPATGGNSGRPLDEFLKTWIRQNIVGRYFARGHLFTISYYGHQQTFRVEDILPRLTTPTTTTTTTTSSGCDDRVVEFGRITDATSFKYASHAPPTKAADAENDGSDTSTSTTDTEEGARPEGGGEPAGKSKHGTTAELDYGSIGGLKREIDAVREVVELAVNSPKLFTEYGLAPPKGILLYGPPGTGKTLIARVVAQQSGCRVYVINGPEVISKYYGESEAKIRNLFKEAADNAPALVFIDEIDAIAGKRADAASEMENRVVATLLTVMGGMEANDRVVVIGATNRPDALDPALRRPGRFDREIEIGIPTAEDRHEILKVTLRRMPHALSPADIQQFAAATHGFVGADLAALCREASLLSLNRLSAQLFASAGAPGEEELLSLDTLVITAEDMSSALKVVRPSTLREVLVDVPKVQWSDIGGQDDTKQKLKEAVEWPLKHPEAFKRMGIRPPRGILLYGPPGCSKTLMAKALATESGANFIAVKGPELFSKWVGESERAVREVFRKARAAAPCIIFFDEIDALAVHRGGGDEGSSGVADRVVSQLLTEMNGIEELKNVTVVAATNRPDMIDKALLRPGRIDRMLYVSPPDAPSRERIFQIFLNKTPHADDIALPKLAELTEGYSGAEIAGVCREACMCAMREDPTAQVVKQTHFVAAIANTSPRITPEMVAFYDQFRRSCHIENI